jgi:hypothetical protein
MYTWGYIKENTLGKLNLEEKEANELGFLSKFPYYANEAMTQICSIKPHEKFFVIVINEENINRPIEMPEDFIAFNDDTVRYFIEATRETLEVGDDFVEYHGYNKIICQAEGTYHIPYNARWFFFTKDVHNATTIPAPADICDAIPSYIVSQCLKIDDEVKAATYRNEFEMFLARLDDTSFARQRTFRIGGDW